MGKIVKDRIIYGGIDSALQNKVGSAPLDTVAQDLSGAVNELKATGGGGNVDDVYVNGVSVLDSNKIAQIDLTGKVNKTGDTMTGNLIIKNATAGAVQITNPNTDLREADNNVSSAQSNQFRIVDDGSHMTMGYFGTTVYPEGLVQGTLQVSNFDTNGDPVSNGISLTVDKDGSKSYSVSDEAAFRRAIGVLNRPAANAGADLSLVTTGDKYTWNNKSDLAIGTTSTTAAAGNHTHTLSLASDSGTSSVSLSANTKYKLTAGGKSIIFTTPSDTNTTYSAGTGISLSGTTFSNSGVRSISTGSSNGTISVNTNGTSANVSVKGLGSAAYSNTSAFAAASHSHSNYQTTLSSTSTNTGGGGTSIRKYGNVCWMPLFNCAANKVGTIPSGYRPGAMCRALLLCIISSKVYYCVGEVSTAGAFKCWYYPAYPGSTSTEIQGTANTLYGEMIWIT